mmetsp:Transcript_61567/g.178572  ORF Transcript_61567/g.178572 Transcript_61567/m.178572 type:complete len:629 (+) Transcript_61567:65-1951(+)
MPPGPAEMLATGTPEGGGRGGGVMAHAPWERHNTPEEISSQSSTNGSSRNSSFADFGRFSSRRSSRSGVQEIGKYIVDPRRALHRYFVFFLACCFIPGPYFHDTLLGVYKAQISDKSMLDISSTSFALLFGLPSAMGALSGPMASVVVRWGDARSSFLSGGLTFLASVGVVISLEQNAYVCVLIFRLLFWLGLYILMAVQTVVVYKLFSGPELTVAMGFIIFACRIGGLMGFLVSGFLLKVCRRKAVPAMWVSVVLVGAAAISATLFAILRGGTVTARTIVPLLEGRGNRAPNGEEGTGLRAGMKRFTSSTWIVVIQLGLLYSAVFPFETIESDFLEQEWGITVDYVGWFTSLGALFGLFAWAWGLCITTTRGLLRWCLFSWVLMFVGFLLLLLQDRNRCGLAALGITFFGLAYSYLSTVLWILIPGTFKGCDCSTAAVSMSYVCMALGMLASNYAAGALHDTISYSATVIWFALLTCAGFGSAVALRRGFPINSASAASERHAGAPAAESADIDALAACAAGEVEVARMSDPEFLIMHMTRTGAALLPGASLAPSPPLPPEFAGVSPAAGRASPSTGVPSDLARSVVSDENYFHSFTELDASDAAIATDVGGRSVAAIAAVAAGDAH